MGGDSRRTARATTADYLLWRARGAALSFATGRRAILLGDHPSSLTSILVHRRRAKGSTSASGAKHLWAATAAGLPARRRQTICCGERGAQP